MKTRLIRNEDLVRLTAAVDKNELMDRMIERLDVACREFDGDRTEVRARDGFHYTEPFVGLVEWMPIMRVGDTVTIKTVGYHPANPDHSQVPTILSTIGLWDTATGHMIGLADGVFLTALRTGAASAVASRELARPDSRTIGLIGTGAQAVTQLHALLRCFPLERVLLFDTNPASVSSFESRVASFVPAGMEIREAPVDLLVQSSDIICTATSVGVGTGPVFSDMETKPWLHINAVGADLPGKTELPLGLLQRAVVCPDYQEQATQEGECQQLQPEQIGPDLVQLLQSSGEHEAWRERLTVFDSTGYALEDEAAMKLLLEYCDLLGLGVELELEANSGDPLNPYDFSASEVEVSPDVTLRKA